MCLLQALGSGDARRGFRDAVRDTQILETTREFAAEVGTKRFDGRFTGRLAAVRDGVPGREHVRAGVGMTLDDEGAEPARDTCQLFKFDRLRHE